MRGWRILSAVVLVTAGLAGCIGVTEDPLESQSAATPVSPDDVEAPTAAQVVDTEEGVRLVMENVKLPLQEELSIPEGVELVRVTAESASETPILPLARSADSDALRCLPALRQAWNVGYGTQARCSGLTAMDPAPTNWTIEAYGGNYQYLAGLGLASTGYESATAETIQVDLIEEAGGGVIDQVDTSQLSKPHHDVGETTNHTVTSHDGAELFVQVTTPEDGHESYPTLLVSSPYTYSDRASGNTAYDHLIEDYVSRGYAVVVADVRGFARSDGCLEVWGPNEQEDQAVLVEWITEQDFSDGNVGMYGVSYPGTTPVEAAVQDPEGLEAIVSTAGVLNAYRDWHFGGVPNGENIGSPVFYQVLGTDSTSQDPVERAEDTASGVCDPTLLARANDPRAVYDEYYESRNFTARADEVTAAVMVEHAYEDPNVKASMQLGWFNELDVPKLGLFGHWSHQPGARADEPTLRLAWMDQFVKGTDLGLGDVSKASISANGDRYREADAWPSANTTDHKLYPAFEDGELAEAPQEGEVTLLAEPTGTVGADAGPLPTRLVLERTLTEDVSVAGHGALHLDVSLPDGGNAFLAAYLYEGTGGDAKQVTHGWANLAHRDDHASYDPLTPGERVQVRLPLIPTEYTFEEGETIQLEIRGVTQGDWGRYKPGRLAEVTLHGGEDGTVLDLPTVDEAVWETTPTSVDTVPAE